MFKRRRIKGFLKAFNRVYPSTILFRFLFPRALAGSLASFDTSSIVNTEGVPLLEENEFETEGSGNSVRIKRHPTYFFNVASFQSLPCHRSLVTLQVLTVNPALNPDEEGG